jgi:hypothetical protein
MDLHEGDRLQGLWLSSNGNLVYMVAKQRPDDPTKQDNLTVYPDKLLWADTSTPQYLTSISYSGPNYQTGNQNSSSFSSGPLSMGSGVVAGPGVVAYCPASDDSGQLQVMSYDGTSSVTVADKGCKLYDWTQYAVFRGLR